MPTTGGHAAEDRHVWVGGSSTCRASLFVLLAVKIWSQKTGPFQRSECNKLDGCGRAGFRLHARSYLPESIVVNLFDAARGGAGLGEDEVAVGAAHSLARQIAVAHELVELGAVHVPACLFGEKALNKLCMHV